jgi:hypothetical protein
MMVFFSTEAGYPTREQSVEHCLCSGVWKRKGFCPVGAVVHSCEVVLKSCRGLTRSIGMWREWAVVRGKLPEGMTVWQETLECWQV